MAPRRKYDSDSESDGAAPHVVHTLGDGPMSYELALHKAHQARATIGSRAEINAPKCTPEYYLNLDRIERPEVYNRETTNSDDDSPSDVVQKKRRRQGKGMSVKGSTPEQNEGRSRKHRKTQEHSEGQSRKHRKRRDRILSRSDQTLSEAGPDGTYRTAAEPEPDQTLSESVPRSTHRKDTEPEQDRTLSESNPEANDCAEAQPEPDQTLSEPERAATDRTEAQAEAQPDPDQAQSHPEPDQTLSKPERAVTDRAEAQAEARTDPDQTQSEIDPEATDCADVEPKPLQTLSQHVLNSGVDQRVSGGVVNVNKDVIKVDELRYDSEVEEVNNHIDSSFVEYLVTVRLDQITLPDVAPGFTGEHLQYVSTLLKKGYEHTRGLIVVYAHPKYFKPWSKKDKITNLATRSDLHDILQVVDGVYRTLYLKKESSPASKLVVAVVQRQDNRPLSEEDLFSFGIRKNALSAQRKKPSVAHNIKVSNSVVRTIERQLKIKVRQKSIYWLQKKIMEVMNKSSFNKLNSIRGYAELAHTCCGRPDIQELIERIVCVTPQIGISHLVLNEHITGDVCVLEIYLLSLRKALIPQLIGPEQFDSQNLVDSEDLHSARLADFVHFKDEVFKDIRKLCRIFRVSGGDGDAGIGLQASDIINTPIHTRYEVMDINGVSSEKDFTYAMKDLITDQVSKWFSERISDRVSSVSKVCEGFISVAYPEHLSGIQETRRNVARSFKPLKLKAKKRDQGSKKKPKKNVPDSIPS